MFKRIGLLNIIYCVILCIINSACKGSFLEPNISAGDVKIIVKGVSDLKVGDYGSGKSSVNNSVVNLSNYETNRDLPNGVKLIANLIPDQIDGSDLLVNHSRSKIASVTSLGANVVYRVVVYNSDGTFNKMNDFIYGQNAIITGLDDEATYTFVVYSVNTVNSADLPSLNVSSNIDQANISVSSDVDYLMYYKTQVTVDYEQANSLNVILDHKLSQITTTVNIDNKSYSKGARLKLIDAPKISPHRSSATMNLLDGSMSYGSLTTGKTLTGSSIPTGGVQSYAFNPVNVISGEVTNAVLSFPKIIISSGSDVGLNIDITNQDYELTNLNLRPGYRYNLNLNIIMPCVDRVESLLEQINVWPTSNHADGYVHESSDILFSQSNYGGEFNIYKLDQSFQLIINGNEVFSREVEFDYWGANDRNDAVDVVFPGGVKYGTNGISVIYNLLGSYANNKPIVKVVVDINGNVSLYGSRVSYTNSAYALEPLTLINGVYINSNLVWNSSGNNIIKLKQTQTGPTNITYNAVGYKKLLCP